MAKVKEVLEDAKFNEFLGYEIEAYNNRPEPKEGLKYRRTPYDALKEKGLFTVESIRAEFVKAANLESDLPSKQREAIVGLVFKVAQTVVNYRAKEEAEAIEYECTNNNPYGLKEYRDGCTQHCDGCDYYQPIKK